MRSTKNENGYALLIVLFLIVFISILSTVFITSSISNANQEQIVDDRHLTINAAELGVDYYTSSLMNTYYSSQKDLEKFVQDQVDEAIKLKKIPDYKVIQNKVVEKLKNILIENGKSQLVERAIIPGFSHQLIGVLKADDKIENANGSKDFTISGIVKGKNNETTTGKNLKTETLIFKQRFTVPLFTPTTSATPNFGETLNLGLIIKKENECKNEQEIKNKECYTKGKNDLEKLEDVENSIIYATAGLHVKNELEVEKNSKMYIDGDMDVFNQKKNNDDDDGLDIEEQSFVYVSRNVQIKGELEIEDKSYMYVGNDLDVKEDLDLDDSQLYVGRNLDVKKEIELEEKSTLYVGGYLDAKDEVELKDKSKICVAGQLKIKGKIQIEEGSYIYYLTTSDRSHTNLVKVNTLKDLQTKCGVNEKAPQKVEWLKPKTENVTY